MPASTAPEMVPLFSFHGVGVQRDGRWILRDVTARVPSTGVTAIVGPSGSGKTTLLRLCNRLEIPDLGAIDHRGQSLAHLAGPAVLRLRREVAMVFQQPALFGGTVRDNLLVALPSADEPRLLAALADAGLPATLLEAQAGRLSGGEAQRACLARTLITEPSVLLLDEPTSALDPDARLAFERLILHRLAGAAPVPALWVTHDHDQVQRVADHVIALDGGRLTYAGPPTGLPRPAGART